MHYQHKHAFNTRSCNTADSRGCLLTIHANSVVILHDTKIPLITNSQYTIMYHGDAANKKHIEKMIGQNEKFKITKN